MILNNSGTVQAYRCLSTSFSRLERDIRRRGAFSPYWDSNAFSPTLKKITISFLIYAQPAKPK